MNATILERPFRLAYRAISTGVFARLREERIHGKVIASSNLGNLIKHHEVYSKGKANTPHYIWAILDGYYACTKNFAAIINSKETDFVDDVLMVGDIASRLPNNPRSGKAIQLLLDSEICMDTIDFLGSNPLGRLCHTGHLPPWTYAVVDTSRALRRRISGEHIDNTLSRFSPRSYAFAGNDGQEHPWYACHYFGLSSPQLNRLRELQRSQFNELLCTVYSDRPPEDMYAKTFSLYSKLRSTLDSLASRCKGSSKVGYTSLDGARVATFQGVMRCFLIHLFTYRKLLIYINYPGFNFHLYQRQEFKRFRFLDFGGASGFEPLYPRSLDCRVYGKEVQSVCGDLKVAFDAAENNDKDLFIFCIRHLVENLIASAVVVMQS